MHTLATLCSLTSELVHAEDPEEGDSDIELVMEEEDEEERRRNEELGLGGEGLKALLGEMKGSSGSGGIVKGGEVVAVLWERMMNTSGFVLISISFIIIITETCHLIMMALLN